MWGTTGWRQAVSKEIGKINLKLNLGLNEFFFSFNYCNGIIFFSKFNLLYFFLNKSFQIILLYNFTFQLRTFKYYYLT